MALNICTLASGSKGNSAVVYNENTAVLIDAGVSYTGINERLKAIGLCAEDLDAVLLTHTHSDHVCGLEMLVKKTGVLVYTHLPAIKELSKKEALRKKLVEIECGDFFIGGLTVSAFRLSHDAFCYGYGLLSDGRKITYMTDLGYVDKTIIGNANDSDILLIESNHDVQTLATSKKYPEQLKRRILSTRGHLSNDACAQTVLKLASYGTLRQVILAHLSENNNTPETALNCIKGTLNSGGVKIGTDIFVDVASQHESSKIFGIE